MWLLLPWYVITQEAQQIGPFGLACLELTGKIKNYKFTPDGSLMRTEYISWFYEASYTKSKQNIIKKKKN